MTRLFQEVLGAVAVTRTRPGTYRQTKVYRWAGHVYVPHGSGFLRVARPWNNEWPTSKMAVVVVHLDMGKNEQEE